MGTFFQTQRPLFLRFLLTIEMPGLRSCKSCSDANPEKLPKLSCTQRPLLGEDERQPGSVKRQSKMTFLLKLHLNAKITISLCIKLYLIGHFLTGKV